MVVKCAKKGPYTVNSAYSFGRPDWALVDNNYIEIQQTTTSNTLIKKGAYGSEVVKIQEKLILLGYDLGISGADGDFGQKTETAIIDFQKKRNILADGVVGN